MSTRLGVGPAFASLVIGFLAAAYFAGALSLVAQQNPFDTVVDARMGRRLFQAECGRCHGDDAKGNDEAGGPDLTTGVFNHASTDTGLFEVVRDGVSGTTMVGISWAPEDEIWQIVTYLNSLSINPDNYDLPGSVESGELLFNAKGECSNCHMVDGVGGRLGPDLSSVATRRRPEELRVDLTYPNETVEPRWWTMRVTQSDGTVIEGLRMNEDTFSLRVMDENENLWHFSKHEIRSSEREESSTMPSVSETLTTTEVDDLVAYLFSLRKESSR